jgi:uncharacterized protein YjbJ (UPF0337 family)
VVHVTLAGHYISLSAPDSATFAYASTTTGQDKLKEMNANELLGHWNIAKGKLKQRYGNLTDDDLLLVGGRLDELMGRLQARLGKTKDELQKLISEL